MRATKLRLKNYRGFAEATLDFPDGLLTVFSGPNGCGKSSALDATASLLSAVPMVIAGQLRAMFGVGAPNIHGDATSARWTLDLANSVQRTCIITAAISRDPEARNRTPQPEQFGFVTKWSEALAAGTADTLTLPLLSHLHSGSTRLDQRHPTNEAHLTGRLAAYIGAFDQEAAHFADFERWFEQQENLENQYKIRSGSLRHNIPTLRAVRGALLTFLKALEASSLSDFHIVRQHADGPQDIARGRLAASKDGNPLFLDQLSDGERRLILLVGDVARRMAVLNPHLDTPTDSPGILLADEVDQHLHPAWQRRVVPALRKAFPNVQLILTTHSPQVLASVDSEAVVMMKQGAFIAGHPRVRGRDTNTLLSEVFDVGERPQQSADLLEELYTTIEGNPTRAKELYTELVELLEETDPELARIETLLELVGAR